MEGIQEDDGNHLSEANSLTADLNFHVKGPRVRDDPVC